MSINPPLSGLCEQRPFAERRGLIHQPQFFALYKETPMAFRIKPAGASGSRVCGMAASLPNEAEFGFWPPRFLKQKPVALFCFFTSPEGQLPRRGIVVIGAGPKARCKMGASPGFQLFGKDPGFHPDPSNPGSSRSLLLLSCLFTSHTSVLKSASVSPLLYCFVSRKAGSRVRVTPFPGKTPGCFLLRVVARAQR